MTTQYENYPIGDTVVDINDFIACNDQFKDEQNAVVFCLNWQSGFGSNLSVFTQNMVYLHGINPSAHILPYFCKNSDNFKYHDETLHNSFFQYFSYNRAVDISACKVYFVKSIAKSFIGYPLPPYEHSPCKEHIDHFRKYFTLRIGLSIYDYIQRIRVNDTPLVGIHIRSVEQKYAEYHSYLAISIHERLRLLKDKLDKTLGDYTIFVASDVTMYIGYAQEIFGAVHFIQDISRINNEGDSVPQFYNTGIKLGNDILYDCLALSLCDTVYVSPSNVPLVIAMINPATRMIEY